MNGGIFDRLVESAIVTADDTVGIVVAFALLLCSRSCSAGARASSSERRSC